jgi:hypothetical protein
MSRYDFALTFALPHPDQDPERHLDALFAAGCDDAAVGVGRAGMIGLDFSRSAETAEHALRSAIRDVRTAIPGAILVQAGPDLVGLSDMAEIFGYSRQNMRKYATGQIRARATFPPPSVVGDPSLWHLAEITAWLRLNTDVQPPADLCAVARAAAKINFEVERARLERLLHQPAK